MKKATEAAIRRQFSTFLKGSQSEPIAVLMAVHDEDELDRLVFASSRRLQEILDAGRKKIRTGRGIPNDEFWKQVEEEQPVLSKGKRKSRRLSTPSAGG